MSAFARALGALHADPNLSVPCAWTPGWDRDWPRTLDLDLEAGGATLSADAVSLRGIEGKEEARSFGASLQAIAPRRTLDIRLADLPVEPAREESITIGAEAFLVETAERDLEGLTWRLVLSDAPA